MGALEGCQTVTFFLYIYIYSSLFYDIIFNPVLPTSTISSPFMIIGVPSWRPRPWQCSGRHSLLKELTNFVDTSEASSRFPTSQNRNDAIVSSGSSPESESPKAGSAPPSA